MANHDWKTKRTEKGVKPVREWLECAKCGLTRDGKDIGSEPVPCEPR